MCEEEIAFAISVEKGARLMYAAFDGHGHCFAVVIRPDCCIVVRHFNVQEGVVGSEQASSLGAAIMRANISAAHEVLLANQHIDDETARLFCQCTGVEFDEWQAMTGG